MLSLLHIENIAVIESADIPFHPGFNVLTGETGAGKSIVIDSIGAILGSRVSRGLVRAGAARAYVSASFTGLSDVVAAGLRALGAEPDEDGGVILSRELAADGKSVCRVNGRPVTATVLREAGNLLVNIHGQHDSQQLLNESTHLTYLDRFGSDGGLLQIFRDAYAEVQKIEADIRALTMDEAEKARRVDMLNYQIEQLESADLKPGEEEKLLKRRRFLQNASRLSEAIATAIHYLYGDDDFPGACGAAKEAAKALERGAQAGEEVASLCERLEEAQDRLSDLAGEVLALSDHVSYNEEELDAIEGRLDTLSRLQKRYGGTVEKMLEHLERCRDELSGIQTAEERMKELEVRRAEALSRARKAALALSEHRGKAARELEARITRELQELDMRRARFEVALTRAEENGEPRLSRDGIDRAVFLISVNAGEPPKPLSRVASGGELARVMLALKNILAADDDVQTLIFDEVDAGVSGHAAQKVAEKLAQVARLKQVLCVTHSTQLGAMADTHFLIRKTEREGRVFTGVEPLDAEGRAQELARITSGAQITQTAVESARELLAAAAQYKQESNKPTRA